MVRSASTILFATSITIRADIAIFSLLILLSYIEKIASITLVSVERD